MGLKISIVNFKKYQLDTAKMVHWFRVDTKITTSESLFGLSHSSKWVWICILAHGTEKKAGEFELNIDWASTVWDIKKKDLLESIEFLKERGLLGVNSESTRSELGANSVLQYNTNNTNNTIHNGQNKFDLESLFSIYPRKIGKKEGIKKLRSLVKNQTDLENIRLSIINYSDYCRNKDPKYIKHFDSFLSVWEDYREKIIEKSSSSINPDIFEGTPA